MGGYTSEHAQRALQEETSFQEDNTGRRKEGVADKPSKYLPIKNPNKHMKIKKNRSLPQAMTPSIHTY